ncbi:hypothetical protein DJ031_04540 [bacterium endosymbiont of Escarpia laminata]|nr:MAG: hypothetical protein DJ031_04540 [bacterium endosymbiont of Escarpia laminata]
MNLTQNEKELYKAYAADVEEKETYEMGQGGEQYYGMKPEYRAIKAGPQKGKIEIRILNTKEKEVGLKRAFITLEEYANRPAAGKEKREARWAFNHCGVEV